MSKWIFGVVLFLVAAVTWAQTRKSDPRLQYAGAITINSANPKALAGWYTEKLGSMPVPNITGSTMARSVRNQAISTSEFIPFQRELK